MSAWMVSDYEPTKRIGMEAFEGAMNMFERRMDERAMGEPTPQSRREEGAWLALQLILTGRFQYPEDFLAVFDNKCRETFGWEE